MPWFLHLSTFTMVVSHHPLSARRRRIELKSANYNLNRNSRYRSKRRSKD